MLCSVLRTAHLAKLKALISEHILNVTLQTLQSLAEHAVSRYHLLTENDGQHISILNMFFTSLANYKNQFDGYFLCGFECIREFYCPQNI